MFNWGEANGDTAKADELDCRNLPDFYFTLIISLTDCPDTESGATQFVLGSHRTGVDDALASNRFATNAPSKAGDAVLFNGKIIHRGLGNSNAHIPVRHAAYAVFSAKWYNDD